MLQIGKIKLKHQITCEDGMKNLKKENIFLLNDMMMTFQFESDIIILKHMPG